MHQQLTDSSGAIFTKYLGSHTEPLASLFGLSEVLAPLHTKTNVGLTDVYQTYWMKPDGLDKMHEITPQQTSCLYLLASLLIQVSLQSQQRRCTLYNDEHQQLQHHHPNEFLVPLPSAMLSRDLSKSNQG